MTKIFKYFDSPITPFMLAVILFLAAGTVYSGYLSLFDECTIEQQTCQAKCFNQLRTGLRSEIADYSNPHAFMEKCQNECRTCK